MEEKSSDSRDLQSSLQDVKKQLALKRFHLLQEEIEKLKVEICSYGTEEGEVIDLTSEEDEESLNDPSYDKLEGVVLYYHKVSGYYYYPKISQFLTPVITSSEGPISQESPAQPVATEAVATATMDEDSSEVKTRKLLEQIATVSDMASHQGGFVYDSHSGMYYDAQSGMYYDQNSQLYYNAQFGAYFYYDSENSQYKLHSLAEGGGARDTGGVAPPDDQWDPCIRLVVVESAKLQTGCLFVVTTQGAQIGREESSCPRDIRLPELEVSKLHAEISFDSDEDLFFVTDLGSRNGTFLNDNLLVTKPKERSKPHPLSHGNTIQCGSTQFAVHIHVGMETCDQCEPGLLHAPLINKHKQIYTTNKKSVAGQRRSELLRLKKKYGLQGATTARADKLVGYVDRAAMRRATVGSDVPDNDSRPDAPASSVARPIECGNMGRKLLEKLGWNTGQGLGRDNTGILEPVSSEFRGSRAGLGSNYSSRSLDDSDSQSRTARHERLMKHYQAT